MSAPAARLPPTQEHAIRILLLEDVAATAQIVAGYVRAAAPAALVDCVATLGEALHKLASGAFDLVLADLNLPDSSGLGTLDRLIEATDRLIVVLTVDESPGLRQAAIGRGAYDFLSKSRLSRAAIDQIVRLAGIQASTFRFLRESEARFRSLTELSSDFYWETDAQHRILQTRHVALHRAVNTPGSQIGRTRWEIPSVSPDAVGWAAHRAMLEAHQPFRDFEIARRDAGGAVRHLSISGEPRFDEDGAFAGYRGVGREITARKRTEDELRSAVSLLSATLESTTDGILALSADETIALFNQRLLGMFRIPSAIIASRDGRAALAFLGGLVSDAAAFQAKVEELRAQPRAESHDTFELADGRIFERYARPQYISEHPVGRVWSFRDITERRRSEQRIHALAFQDALTGLPNRLLFRDRIAQAMAHAERAGSKLVLLFLDVDNFKSINDTLGHAAGDALLKAVASRLLACVRETDTVSRLGGDEFLIVVTDLASRAAAVPVLEKVISQFRTPFEVEGQALTSSASIGAALFPDDARDPDGLREQADRAMYRAKQSGKNAYCFAGPS